MIHFQQLPELAGSFTSLSLDEIEKVRFMDRMDTKYLFPVNLLPAILKKMNGDYLILQTNGTRIPQYKTIYFDTPEYLFFRQHVRNIPVRNKLRYRIYESTGDVFLEVKRKNARNRTKKWRIENRYCDGASFDSEAKEFIAQHLGMGTNEFIPVLRNSFNRMTFIGKSFNERVTIDLNLSFTGMPGGNSLSFQFLGIAEVKKDTTDFNSRISAVLREISARPTGFSKYCVGSALVNKMENANSLKPKIILINKIENEFNKSYPS